MTNRATPTGWKKTPLKNLFEFKNGVNATKKDYGSGIPFINVMEVILNNCLNSKNIPGKVQLTAKQIEENKVIRGDVLFNRTSETKEEIALTSVYLDSTPVVFGGFVIRGRSKNNELTNDFKKYCFRSHEFRSLLIKAGQGAVRANIGQKDLDKINLSYPSISEQTRIVAVLETWDKAIDELKRKIQIKKSVKKGLMQKLLTGQVRLPSFCGKWVEIRLGDFLTEISKKTTENNQYPMLTSSRRGIFLQSEYFDKQVASENNIGYKILKKGEFTYRAMTDDGVFMFNRSNEFDIGIVSPAYAVFKPKSINSDFLSYMLNIKRFNYEALKYAQGGTRRSLKFKSLAAVTLKIPSTEEQNAIANVLTTADQEIEALEKKLALLAEQKKFLLNNLITGRIRTPETMKC